MADNEQEEQLSRKMHNQDSDEEELDETKKEVSMENQSLFERVFNKEQEWFIEHDKKGYWDVTSGKFPSDTPKILPDVKCSTLGYATDGDQCPQEKKKTITCSVSMTIKEMTRAIFEVVIFRWFVAIFMIRHPNWTAVKVRRSAVKEWPFVIERKNRAFSVQRIIRTLKTGGKIGETTDSTFFGFQALKQCKRIIGLMKDQHKYWDPPKLKPEKQKRLQDWTKRKIMPATSSAAANADAQKGKRTTDEPDVDGGSDTGASNRKRPKRSEQDKEEEELSSYGNDVAQSAGRRSRKEKNFRRARPDERDAKSIHSMWTRRSTKADAEKNSTISSPGKEKTLRSETAEPTNPNPVATPSEASPTKTEIRTRKRKTQSDGALTPPTADGDKGSLIEETPENDNPPHQMATDQQQVFTEFIEPGGDNCKVETYGDDSGSSFYPVVDLVSSDDSSSPSPSQSPCHSPIPTTSRSAVAEEEGVGGHVDQVASPEERVDVDQSDGKIADKESLPPDLEKYLLTRPETTVLWFLRSNRDVVPKGHAVYDNTERHILFSQTMDTRILAELYCMKMNPWQKPNVLSGSVPVGGMGWAGGLLAGVYRMDGPHFAMMTRNELEAYEQEDLYDHCQKNARIIMYDYLPSNVVRMPHGLAPVKQKRVAYVRL